MTFKRISIKFEKIINQCNHRLLLYLDNFADYKRLRGGVYFVDDFPMTPSGKVIRRKVKDMVTQLYENKNSDIDS